MENGFMVKNTLAINISVQKKWEGTIGKAVKVVFEKKRRRYRPDRCTE